VYAEFFGTVAEARRGSAGPHRTGMHLERWIAWKLGYDAAI
jgi:hypothetical protein